MVLIKILLINNVPPVVYNALLVVLLDLINVSFALQTSFNNLVHVYLHALMDIVFFINLFYLYKKLLKILKKKILRLIWKYLCKL